MKPSAVVAISLVIWGCGRPSSATVPDPGVAPPNAVGSVANGADSSGAGAAGEAGAAAAAGAVAGMMGAAGVSASGAPAPAAGRGGFAGMEANGGGGASAGRRSAAGSAGSMVSSAGRVARPVVTAATGTTLVKIEPAMRHQIFEGWGTSLCWWANKVGAWPAAARDAVVEAIVDPVKGLGYNVFRYNIGGGENPAHNHMGAFKEMPGFQPAQGMWTWDADANQRAVLQRIVERGSGVILEAFSNSPPYWMTKSGCASGSSDGSNNLKDDAYPAFADYLTEVVKHFRDSFGIEFRTLEPLNEPNANWWKANGGQEGCHFSASNQQAIIKAVSAQLRTKGLTTTSVSASDENSIDDAYNNLRGFDTMALEAITQINVHSYAGSRRAEVRALATSKTKRLWQSESGPLNQTIDDDTDAAMFMAARIITDLRDLKPEAWIDWQVGDPSRAWATLALNDAQQTFTYLKRFYMHAAFSRYIRPGATFIDINNADMVAALSADGTALAIVARNASTSASKGFTFDLSAFPALGSAAEAHRTSRSENLVALPAIQIQNASLVATLPAYSISVFVIPIS